MGAPLIYGRSLAHDALARLDEQPPRRRLRHHLHDTDGRQEPSHYECHLLHPLLLLRICTIRPQEPSLDITTIYTYASLTHLHDAAAGAIVPLDVGVLAHSVAVQDREDAPGGREARDVTLAPVGEGSQ